MVVFIQKACFFVLFLFCFGAGGGAFPSVFGGFFGSFAAQRFLLQLTRSALGKRLHHLVTHLLTQVTPSRITSSMNHDLALCDCGMHCVSLSPPL